MSIWRKLQGWPLDGAVPPVEGEAFGVTGGSVGGLTFLTSQSVQTQSRFNLTLDGNTSGALALISSGVMTLAGGNNVTLSQAGNAVTISAGAGAAGSQSAGISNLGNTSGTSGVASGSAILLALAGGNNITLSQSLNGASATVTISGPNTVAQSAQTLGLYASSQTTGQSSSSTVDARSVSIVGMGGVSVGLSGGSFVISGGAGAAQTNQTLGMYAVGNTTGESSSTTLDARTVSIHATGILSAGYSAGSIRLSAPVMWSQSAGASNLGNTLGTSGVASGSAVRQIVAATGWLSISQSVDGASVTQSIGGGSHLPRWGHNTAALYSASTSAMVNTSVSIVRMEIPHYVTLSRIDVLFSVTLQTSANTSTAQNNQSWVWQLLTRNASTLNPIVGGSSSVTNQWASSTGNFVSFIGARALSFAAATALTPGEYYLALQASTVVGTPAGTATTNRSMGLSPVHGTSLTTTNPWQAMSAATNLSINQLFPLQGMNSVSISNTAQTHQQSQITQSGAEGQRANLVVVLRNN